MEAHEARALDVEHVWPTPPHKSFERCRECGCGSACSSTTLKNRKGGGADAVTTQPIIPSTHAARAWLAAILERRADGRRTRAMIVFSSIYECASTVLYCSSGDSEKEVVGFSLKLKFKGVHVCAIMRLARAASSGAKSDHAAAQRSTSSSGGGRAPRISGGSTSVGGAASPSMRTLSDSRRARVAGGYV